MFPFVRKSRYNALRKDCQAWMQKAVDNEKRWLDTARKFNGLVSHIRMAYSEATRVPLEVVDYESVLEDE